MPRNRLLLGLAVLAALFFAQAVVRLAWLGDDGFITMRTVENWLGGYGLRWNVADRAQSFTTPLWMFLCALARWLTGETYFTVIAVGFVCTAACIAVLAAAARGGAATVTMLLLCLASSRAFVDYSTSGLENPLSHALAATFVWVWYRVEDPLAKLRWLALLGSAFATNRMDQSLLVLVPILAAARRVPRRQAIAALAPGALPFALWVAFATFYFGTPFPTTAYSKAFTHGVPGGVLAVQGLCYFADLVLRDPATAALLVAGLAAAFSRGGRAGLPLALGVLVYFAYIVKIGGCFMACRFFTTPLVFCLGMLALRTRERPPAQRVAIGAGALLLACLAGLPAGIVGSGRAEDEVSRWTIHDVRKLGWEKCGLCAPKRQVPAAGWLTAQLQSLGIREPVISVHGAVGEVGFGAGPQVHIVDFWLCDPVLCRLPAYDRETWTVHHFGRRIPEGYLELLATGDDRYCNPHFARFAKAMLEITRGELWSWHRLGVVFDMLRGAYTADLQAFVATDYHAPPRQRVPARELAREIGPNTWWFRERARVVYHGGLDIEFDTPQRGGQVELVLEGEIRYHLEWRSGERALGKAVVTADPALYGGLKPYRVALPPEAQGFTTLRLWSEQRPDHVSAVAAVRVLQ